MATSLRAVDESARKIRADQIMNAAAELLLKWGYGKVTIDDVARQAGVGKGTVYLHWKTREELFYSVVLREQLTAVDEQVEAIRRDPREALLHRLVRMKAMSALRRPLLRAVVASDPEILGRLLQSISATDLARLAGGISLEYFQLLIDHRLLRGDLPLPELLYGVGAVTLGFFTGDRYLGAFGGLPLAETRVKMLEEAVERTFGLPPTEEALRAVAPAVIAIFEKSRQSYHDYLTGAYRAQAPETEARRARLLEPEGHRADKGVPG